MMTFPIYVKNWKNKNHVPNHQPVIHISPTVSMKTAMFHGNPMGIPQASLIPWPKALPRLVARRCAVRRPEAGRVAVHGAAGGVAGVVAARQGDPGVISTWAKWAKSGGVSYSFPLVSTYPTRKGKIIHSCSKKKQPVMIIWISDEYYLGLDYQQWLWILFQHLILAVH